MAERRNTLMDPPIEDLLDKVDSKFTLVALGAKRARQINAYYNSLGEGSGHRAAPGDLGVGQAAVDRLRGDRRRQGRPTPPRPRGGAPTAEAPAEAEAPEARRRCRRRVGEPTPAPVEDEGPAAGG